MKVYYEPEKSILKNSKFLNKISNKLQFFEYSVKENGIIDTVNFHTGCEKYSEDNIFLSKESIHDKITEIFDNSYKAYTIGYRFEEGNIVSKSVYYYPTIWKDTRYGIKGITDENIIFTQVERFVENICVDKEAKDEIIKYISYFYKFKGCCITFSKDGPINYKLYGRIIKDEIYNHFNGRIDFDALEKKYGNTVLTAIKIENGCIVGYNFYYLA